MQVGGRYCVLLLLHTDCMETGELFGVEMRVELHALWTALHNLVSSGRDLGCCHVLMKSILRLVGEERKETRLSEFLALLPE